MILRYTVTADGGAVASTAVGGIHGIREGDRRRAYSRLTLSGTSGPNRTQSVSERETSAVQPLERSMPLPDDLARLVEAMDQR